MLYTNLKHLETFADMERVIDKNENVVIICGRMEPNSVTSYRMAEELEKKYPQVMFYDMEFDNPESMALKNAMEYYKIDAPPLIGYFKRNKLVNLAFGRLTMDKFEEIMKKEFELPVNA